jgi:20S proteasome subunit beta 7
LGLVDLRGMNYQDNTAATGYGNYIARALLRKHWREDLTREEAKKLLEDCLRVLFYRDARSANRIQIADITEKGIQISEPYELSTDWSCGKILYGEGIKNTPIIENANLSF